MSFRWCDAKRARQFMLCSIHVILFAVVVSAAASDSVPRSDGSLSKTLKQDRADRAERRRQNQRVYSLLDHTLRICGLTFVSAVFAGLTLGVMCADTFTLEIIAESGPALDCKYAAQVLPLRKQGHKTLCTLIITNMLCNVLIVQEFSTVFDIVYAIRTHGDTSNVVDDSGSRVLNFLVSTTVIVLFAEILPMAICKSKHSLRVAAAGTMFVKVAMVLTYPISVPLGKLLDWVVGTEEMGQVYDRNELRKLMVVHYDQEGDNDNMPKSELNLLLAAMDFQDRTVSDIMTPIEKATYVSENDLITPDFVERLWLSGRSRVPVESASGGHFCDVLVVKDLLTVSISRDEVPQTVAQVVKGRDRLFAMVGASTSLPAMLKFFQDAKTHMAVVFAEDEPHSGNRSAALTPAVEGAAASGLKHPGVSDEHAVLLVLETFALAPPRGFGKPPASGGPGQLARTVGIVTMEDVVEELLNEEIYDEYDTYAADSDGQSTTKVPRRARTPNSRPKAGEMQLPVEPAKVPRANFYSYFTHPEADVPLTDAQVWAVAYFLSRTVKSFILWPPPYIKALLDECGDMQLVVPAYLTTSTSSGTEHSNSNFTPQAQGFSRTDGSASAGGSSRVLDIRSEHVIEFNDPATGAGAALSLPSQVDSPTRRQMQRFDHANFLAQAAGDEFVLYANGSPSECFTLVLGGQVDLLIGAEHFYSRLRSFQFIGEEALTSSFFAPDYSAIVSGAARVFCISKVRFEQFVSFQSQHRQHNAHLRVLRSPQSTSTVSSFVFAPPPSLPASGGGSASRAHSRVRGRIGGGRASRANSRRRGGADTSPSSSPDPERRRLLELADPKPAMGNAQGPSYGRAYGTFAKDK